MVNPLISAQFLQSRQLHQAENSLICVIVLLFKIQLPGERKAEHKLIVEAANDMLRVEKL